MHLLDGNKSWDPYPSSGSFDDIEDRRDAHRAVLISAVGLAATGLVELAIALPSGSVGLLGDSLHNLSDVSTSLVVFLAFRVSRRPATRSHSYGYERAEDLAGLAVALVVWASAVFAGVVSVHKFIVGGRTSDIPLGMVAALVGVMGNQLVAGYKRRVGHRIHSVTLLADAKHSWLDALSSAGALLGLVAVAAGLRWADAVAGLVITGFIVHVGWEVTHQITHHLMDGVEPQVLSAVEAAASAVDGVSHVHTRARWMGRSLVIEVEGFVHPGITVEESEVIGQTVREAVALALPESRAVQWCARPAPLS